MTRVKRSVHARKKRRATLKLAKGYRGDASRHYRTAKEAVLKADQYRYRDRRNRKRDFRRLWITRINAAARMNGMSYSQFMHGLELANVELEDEGTQIAKRPPAFDKPSPPRSAGSPRSVDADIDAFTDAAFGMLEGNNAAPSLEPTVA